MVLLQEEQASQPSGLLQGAIMMLNHIGQTGWLKKFKMLG
jgi:hypothetical protein